MNFLSKFLQVTQMLPALIIGVEGIFGAGNGKTKQQKVLDMVNLGLNFSEAIAQKDIVDQDAFNKAIIDMNDATVRALNASIWHKKA